jgi:hypothetical protein
MQTPFRYGLGRNGENPDGIKGFDRGSLSQRFFPTLQNRQAGMHYFSQPNPNDSGQLG